MRLSALPLALLALAVSALAGGVFAENIDPNNDNSQFAYGENAGWINAEPGNCANCGMQVNDLSVTGYMWGENIGWINLNCSNDSSCGGAAGNWGVTNDYAGNLKGYAWNEKKGWINFSCQNNGTCGGTGNYGVHINPLNGDFSGRAWSENEGWITFASAGPVVYKVKTSWVQTVFEVNSNNDADDGSCDLTHCSLREAINATNASPGANTITFNIPGGGVQTITPGSALPTITDPVTIDATSQPGYAGSPLVEINGTSAGAGVDGFTITAGGSTVEGLAINHFAGNGVCVTGASYTGNTISHNSIFSNGKLGIDLTDGAATCAQGLVTANDLGDPDTGPNNLQNFPVLTLASVDAFATTTVLGTLNSTASTSFTIEFFSSPTCDGSGNGEGQVFLGSLSPVTTDGGGNVSFTKNGLTGVTAGQMVTATATRNGAPLDTSEFSVCRTATSGNLDSDLDSLGQTTTSTTGRCSTGGTAQPKFRDCLELFIGTDPLRPCAATTTANDEAVDAMPADLNNDRSVNVTDRTKMVLQIKAYNANNVTGYNKRYDLNADGAINVTDRTIIALYIKQTGGLPCTP